MSTFQFIGYLILFSLLIDSILRLVLLCLRALRSGRKESPESEPVSELARGCVVLIAARDESGTIGSTVASLGDHLREWPGSSIWVIADRCQDDTAIEAARAGAQVAVRSDGRLGKGEVLAWWLDRHESAWQSREAIVILDADSKLAEGSLYAMRKAILAGADAAQAFVAPDAETASGRLAGWSEVLMQRIDDEARKHCGWSVPLRGTGIVFRGKVLAELASRLHTLAEDLELNVLLAARGSHVAFVPEAIVYDPKPRRMVGAARQRARWLQGHLQVLRDYHREILKALIKGRRGTWFLLWPLMLRPKILFIGLRLVLLFISPWIALTGLAMDMIYYLAGAAIVDNPRRYLLDLLAVPRFGAMWFHSFGIILNHMIRRGQRGWLRAGR